MLGFRAKPGVAESSEWRCCFCLHVRTATIMLGIWHLLLHMLALAILAAIIREPKLLQSIDHELELNNDWSDVAALPTPLSNVEPPPDAFTQRSTGRDHSLMYHDVDMGALVTVCTLAITLMLIYGASRGKPGHILPFFCLQLFDFAITILFNFRLTATGYLCYLSSVHSLVAETPRVPWRSTLLSLPAPTLALLMVGAFFIAAFLKAYCISVVWRCYKYLTMCAYAMHSLRRACIISSEAMGPSVVAAPAASHAPDYSTLLPDYEEAVKQTPPPSYNAAVLMHDVAPGTQASTITEASPLPPGDTAAVLPQDSTTQQRV